MKRYAGQSRQRQPSNINGQNFNGRFFTGDKWAITHTMNRLKENRTELVCIVGDTGTGKSYIGLQYANEVEKRFNRTFTADHVVFNTLDFMKLVNSDSLPKGSVILYDDAGLGISSKQWWEEEVKVFGRVIQSYRYKQIITVITVPDISFIVKEARVLLSLLLQTDPRVQGIVYPKLPIKPRNYSLERSRVYYGFPRVIYNGVKYKIDMLKFDLPPSNLIADYEAKKESHIRAYYAGFEKELEKREKKRNLGHKKNMSPNQLANLKQNKIRQLSNQEP